MFPRTWSEELIAEWLELKGYFVETGAVISTSVAGGRTEVDVIGTRIDRGTLEILHIEVGLVNRGAKKDLAAIQKKFSSQNRQAIIDYVRRKLNVPYTITFSSRYIASHANRKSLNLIHSNGYNIARLEDVIRHEIIPDIQYWKLTAPNKPKIKDPTPPNNLWLIKLLDFMVSKM